MTLLLRWRFPGPQVTLRWRGADRILAVQLAANPDAPIAAIIGPAGLAGPAGPAGPAYDLDNAVIDGGTFN
jgi:hypothetical protein